MAHFPDPPTPEELRERLPATEFTFGAGRVLHRVYKQGGANPAAWAGFRTFGPVDCRFDHHPEPTGTHAEGILYCAPSPVTCIAETFQQTGIINRTHDDPYLTSFATVADLKLLDLTGLWPTQAGASMAICAGSRTIARKWSRAIYLAYPDIQGLLYCSAMHGNEDSLALYERARAALPAGPQRDVPLNSATISALVSDAADELRFGII